MLFSIVTGHINFIAEYLLPQDPIFRYSITPGIFGINKAKTRTFMAISNIRDNIEDWFQATGLWLYRNPWKTLLTTLFLVVFLSVKIPSITIDTSSEGRAINN